MDLLQSNLKKIINIALLFVALLTYGSTHAQIGASSSFEKPTYTTLKIAEITVTAPDKIDKQAILLISGLAVGDEITIPGDQLSKAIKQLWKQNLFSDIQIEEVKRDENGIHLNIVLTQLRRMSRFSFDGISKTDVDDLREELGLIREMYITNHILNTTQNTILGYYRDKGYYNVDVNIKQVQDSLAKDHDIIVIDIHKNPKIKIDEIKVEGNEVLSDSKVKRQLKETKERATFDPFYKLDKLIFKGVKNIFKKDDTNYQKEVEQFFADRVKLSVFKQSKYLSSNFSTDKNTLIAKYNELGYRDAKIVSDTVYKSSYDGITLKLNVNEGSRYYFRNIYWSGNSKYSTKVLSRILNIQKGDVFNQALLEQRLFMSANGTDVSSLYMDNGYLFFQVNPVEVLVENDSIDIEMRIYEGKQATIKRVTVIGNTKTNDHVIMREIRTEPGQLFSRSDIINTQRSLSALGFFDPEQLNVTPKPNPADGTVDIEYVVAEKPSDQLQLSAGWGGQTLYGNLGVTFNNFSTKNIFKKGSWTPLPAGDGQRLNISAQSSGLGYQGYNISFTEPWLGGKKPTALTISAWHNMQSNGVRKYITDSVGGNEIKVLNPNRVYVKVSSLSLALGTRLKWPDDYFTLTHELTYQHYNLKDWNQFVFTTGESNNLFYKTTLSRTNLSDPIYPQSGSQIKASLQLTAPYSLLNAALSNNPIDYTTVDDQQKYKWVEYYKVKFSADWYTNLVGKLVLKSKIGFGFLNHYNNDIGVAPFERFYLGGSGLTNFQLDAREIIALRGYDDNQVFPLDEKGINQINNNGLPLNTGQPIISKYTMELRYPVSLNPQAKIFLLSFLEAGNTWNTFRDFDPFFVKRSGGFGVRAFLPMFGLLGLDWGYRFDSIEARPAMQRSQIHFTIGANLGEL